MYRSFSIHFIKGFAVFALFLILSGGSLTFAAGNALPGDALYSIKIHVAENIREVLAFSTEAKARVQASHLQTRLTEIDTLKSDDYN